MGKKPIQQDTHALEVREVALAELATGWEATTPVWLGLDFLRRRPVACLGLLASQVVLLGGAQALSVALGPFARWVVPLVAGACGLSLALGLPAALERDLRDGDQVDDAELLREVLRAAAPAAHHALSEYQFDVGHFAGLGCAGVATPAVSVSAMLLSDVIGGPFGDLVGWVGVLLWLSACGVMLLQSVLIPFLLSLPACLFGLEGRLAQARAQEIVARNGASLTWFAVPAGAVGLLSFSFVAVLARVFPVAASWGLWPGLGFLFADVLLGLWTLRYLYELRVEQERLETSRRGASFALPER